MKSEPERFLEKLVDSVVWGWIGGLHLMRAVTSPSKEGWFESRAGASVNLVW